MSRVLFVGGGTLGSLNPLLATAKVVQENHPEVECDFWVSKIARDGEVVREAGFTPTVLPSGKFRRYFSLQNLVDIPVIIWATYVAWKRLKERKPAIVVTAGSFVAVPVAWAARRLRLPILLYQQDTTLGFANRLIARASTVRTATSDLQAKLLQAPVEIVGYALRLDLHRGNAERVWAKYGLQPEKLVVLVIGGSSGALGLNQKFIAALPYLNPELQILHITGDGKAPALQRPGYVQIPFTYAALADLYAAASFAITRAGSNVLAELIALGKPMCIVPLPGTHQVQNAASLEDHGALVCAEATLEPQVFAEIINHSCTSAGALKRLAAKTANAWDVDGAPHLAQIVERYL